MRKVTGELESRIRSDLHWVLVEPGTWPVWRDVRGPTDAVVWHQVHLPILLHMMEDHDSDAFDTTRPLP